MMMKSVTKKILLGVGVVSAVSFAAGALMYKRYMDDFYEYIMGEENPEEMEMVDETDLCEDDFAQTGAEVSGGEAAD